MKPRLRRKIYKTLVPFALGVFLSSNTFGAGREEILHFFHDKPAENPSSNLIFDAQGNLYGATYSSGHQACECGTIFRLSPQADGTWDYRVLYQFMGKGDGGYPFGNLVFDTSGNLYGVSGWGPGIFRLTPQPDGSWTETTIYTFAGAPEPYSGLTIDKFGNLYGTTRIGGDNGLGAVYQLSPTSDGGWSGRNIYSFSGSDGEYPWADVTLDHKRNVYGTTVAGGQYGFGTVYELTPNAGDWTETVLYSFTADHYRPAAGVFLDSSGTLYGTASDNSAGPGAVFSLKPNSKGGWTESVVHTFGGKGDGAFPWSDLVPDAAGNLYGTTYVGGAHDYGIIYKLTRMSGGGWKETVFHSFNYRDGANPAQDPVTFDGSGNLFVATSCGGLEGYCGLGVAIKIAP